MALSFGACGQVKKYEIATIQQESENIVSEVNDENTNTDSEMTSEELLNGKEVSYDEYTTFGSKIFAVCFTILLSRF
jgi:hypothetical protein